MTESLRKQAQERFERQRAEEAVVERGWKSTGDVPYIIAAVIGKSSGSITNRMTATLQAILATLDKSYALENVKKIGPKTFVSPDLLEKIKLQEKKYYQMP